MDHFKTDVEPVALKEEFATIGGNPFTLRCVMRLCTVVLERHPLAEPFRPREQMLNRKPPLNKRQGGHFKRAATVALRSRSFEAMNPEVSPSQPLKGSRSLLPARA